jgi:hypothetical protein
MKGQQFFSCFALAFSRNFVKLCVFCCDFHKKGAQKLQFRFEFNRKVFFIAVKFVELATGLVAGRWKPDHNLRSFSSAKR